MSVVGSINSSFARQMSIGHRRVRAMIGIPVVVACGLLGAVAGQFFPLPPAAVMHPAISTSHASIPKDQAGAGRATLTTGSSASVASPPGQSAAPPREQGSSPVVASQKTDAVEQPSHATSRVGEGRQHANHNNLLSDRIRQGKRERSAASRRRIRGRERPAQQGQLSQLPFLGPVTGALLP